MDAGSEAASRMATLDAQAGFADPQKTAAGTAAGQAATGVLDDSAIAQNLLTQAGQLETQITGLQEEIVRLKDEAYTLDPSKKPKNKGGRPKKVRTEEPAPAPASLKTSSDEIASNPVNIG
jgi:uncharacterized small protein (DUF1192 family)